MVQLVIWFAVVALAFAGVFLTAALDQPDAQRAGATPKAASPQSSKKDVA